MRLSIITICSCTFLASWVILYDSCFSRYDPKLMTPDCCGHGYNLTPLGCLVYGPWEADWNGYNVALYLDGKEISSVKQDYTEQQKDLVFELLRDGSVNHWFKSDYDSSLKARTTPDENGIGTISKYKPQKGEIKHIFKGGKWKANFLDSTLTISFGKNSTIPEMTGGYAELGSDYIYFKETSYFDSTYNGKATRFKKVTSTRYTHPYINNLEK